MKQRTYLLGMLAMAVSLVPPAEAHTSISTIAPPAEPADDIIVTARRSGIPVWRVRSGNATVILVGAIEEVSRGTRWDPSSLTAALRQADQIVFPQDEVPRTSASDDRLSDRISADGQTAQGQTLRQLMPPDQFERLVALRGRAALKPGFERTHPLHLALHLHDVLNGKGYGLAVKDYVRHAVKKYKLNQVPISRRSLEQPIYALSRSTPEAHLPCLISSISLIEAGPQTIAIRSQ